MTEVEWLKSADLRSVLTFADGCASRRQSHLFALAWVERHRNYLSSRAAWVFDVVRRRVDGDDDSEVFERAKGVASEEYDRAIERWCRQWATPTHMLWRLLIAPDEPWGYRGPSDTYYMLNCTYRNLAPPEEKRPQ